MTEVERPPRIMRVLRRLQPREGWTLFALALVAAFSLPGAVLERPPAPGLAPLLWLTPLAVGSAWWLAQRWPGRRAWELLGPSAAAFGGGGAILIWGVYAFDPWPPLAQTGRWVGWWLRCAAQPACSLPAPPLTAFAEQWARLTGFGQRVGWWLDGAARGQGVADNLALAAAGMLIGWLAAAWLGWWIARRGQTFTAILPTGFLLIEQVYWADAGYGWLLVFLAALAPLLALTRFHRLTQGWEGAQVDYSPEVRLELALASIALAAMATAAAPVLPFLTSAQVSEAFWRIFRQPYQQIEERLEASFPGVQPGRSLVPPSGVAVGGLPRAHLLGGRPELGREVALRVLLRGANPDDPLYFRGQTFGRYTGVGWGERDRPPRQPALNGEFAAGQPWNNAPAPPASHPVLSAVEVFAASRAVLYAAGEPAAADRPYRAELRAAGELIALAASDRPARYTVLGQIAAPDEATLRATGDAYPAAIADLYLELPPDLPPELAALTAEITAGAAAPYDRAIAIEAALRRLPYTLDVPAPPADREVVSWFLLDLRQGYCDYFATAMAVLARLSGIPSRLAVGYAGGAADAQTGAYTLTELDAHSWPELYFPGYGWLPFEPTPARPAPERDPGSRQPFPLGPRPAGPADFEAGLDELRELAQAEAVASARLTWAGRLLGLANLLLLGGWLWSWRRLHTQPTPPGLAGLYARLAVWGGRLGRPLRPADTPAEYAAALAATASALAGRARWRRTAARAAAAIVQTAAPRLSQAFTETTYGPEPAPAASQPAEAGFYLHRPAVSTAGEPPPRPPSAAAGAWRALWPALRRLWWAQRRI